jgi:hypothetical protein
MGLSFTMAAGPRQRVHFQVRVLLYPMTIFHCLDFRTPPTWRVRFPYLYAPETGLPNYTTRHWVLSPPATTSRATADVLVLASTRALIVPAWDPRCTGWGRTQRKHYLLYSYMLIHCCRNVFIVTLRREASSADHRKRRFYIVAPVRFRGNVFTESMPSNELFRLSGVTSPYK